MRIIAAADYRRMRWKNGGGETIEIAVSPDGATMDDFDWRLSMALVEQPGPFSSFPGIDRTLAVLTGKLLLRRTGQAAVMLDDRTLPLAFPGELAIESEPRGGAVRDLNIMSRRGRWRHRMERIAVARPITLSAEGETQLLMPRGGGMSILGGAGTLTLSDGDTALIENSTASPIEITPQVALDLYRILLWSC